MVTEYNSEGRLPIHEAAFRNYDTVIDRIIENIISKDLRKLNDDETARTDEEKQRAHQLHRARIHEMLEAVTFDYYRLTPLLAATIGNARQAIECLIKHGAKVTCRDGDNRSMAGIAILKQNVDLFLYFAEGPYAQELDLWNTLITMFTSKAMDESSAAGRVLEQLTSPQHIQFTWFHLAHLRPAEKAIQVLIHTVNNSSNEQLITSCLIVLYNLMSVDPNVRLVFQQNEESIRTLVKLRKSNDQLALLFAHIACHLCDDPKCLETLVRHNVINELQILLNDDTEKIPLHQARVYFETLSKIARYDNDYQSLIQNSSAAPKPILDRAIDLLETFDHRLTIAILHFIRDLCSQNEQQQQICAGNRLLIAHLLSALNSMHRDVQRSSVDTLQMIITQNTISQLTILQQGGAEQLLTLLSKATLPRLRISIICTLWSLTGNQPARRQAMAYALGVSALVEFLNLKTLDQLYMIVDAIAELLRRVPNEQENIAVKLGRRHCIPPIVRLLAYDHDEQLVFRGLYCIQQLCLLPTFRACRTNQTIFQKANGFNQVLLLIRRANHNKLLQAKALTTLAYAMFDHKENKDILSKTVIQQLFKRLASLLNASDEQVQIEAGAALTAFTCSDVNFYNLWSEMIPLDLDHFRFLLESKDVYIRCHAAFQIIVLVRLLPDADPTEWMTRALLALFKVVNDPKIDEEEKILPIDLIGRLARVPTGFGVHKHSGVCEAIVASDGLEHLTVLLNSSNPLVHGNAAVTIGCLAQDSPEGQRRLFKQCRRNPQFLDILRKYVLEPAPLRARIDDMYAAVHREEIQFPPIRKTRAPRRVPTF